MHSLRNATYEEPYNGPGTTTHHRADGANYLSITGHEYDGIWPVYDWQKISGATIMQKPEMHVDRNYGGKIPVQMKGLSEYVGAVYDGLYGAVANDFISPHDRLEAKKSWFFFDDEYVCLGAGIRSNPELPVYTTINQVHLRGDVTVSRQGKVSIIPQSRSDLENVKWVHHDRVGYIFPEPTTVNLSNGAQLGRWSDISATKTASRELVTLDVFLLGFDHGIRPQNASYQYIVVPGVTAEEVASTSAGNRDIVILSNTPALQGVMHSGLGICQLVFYKAGEVEISDGYTVRMESQGMVMLKMNGNRMEKLSVSDPFRKLTSVTLTVPGIYKKRGENFTTRPNETENSTLIVVDLPTDVYAGSSTTIEW
jgi:chondroitin AC lyase